MRTWLPPFLRGLGSTTISITGIITVGATRADFAAQHAKTQAARQQNRAALPSGAPDPLASLTIEVQAMRQELDEKSLTEAIIANPWFEGFEFLGAAIFASSFFTESFLGKQ